MASCAKINPYSFPNCSCFWISVTSWIHLSIGRLLPCFMHLDQSATEVLWISFSWTAMSAPGSSPYKATLLAWLNIMQLASENHEISQIDQSSPVYKASFSWSLGHWDSFWWSWISSQSYEFFWKALRARNTVCERKQGSGIYPQKQCFSQTYSSIKLILFSFLLFS